MGPEDDRDDDLDTVDWRRTRRRAPCRPPSCVGRRTTTTATGAINEAESIQPKDTGQFYRQVDCKYIYNLDVSSLSGSGTYTVWARIGGVNLAVPATFDLR